jgi:hypothetical protein
MSSNRMREFEEQQALPDQRSQITPGFMLWPLANTWETPFMVWQRHVYEQAFREAQAVVRPSILERRLLEYWN